MKNGASVGFTFGPGSPSVARDDASYIGKADAVAGKLGGAMQALEHAEQLAGVLHVEAGAVVSHEELVIPRGGAGEADLDLRQLAVTGVLHRVAEQVLP